jgi:hypothetical protein
MSPFVEECRQEWKRLGVPDLLAEEMATDLEADLAEAEADGVSAAEMVGESDPRRFAATWATERGLVSEPAPPERRRRIWPWVVLAVLLLGGFFVSFALSSVSAGPSSHSARPATVTPPPKVAVPNVVGMRACKATRTLVRSGVDVVRMPGHEHVGNCNLFVVAQAPAPGSVLRRHGHPVRVTLRLRRTRR